MDKETAIAWMKGEKSMKNLVPREPFETWQARIAETDAACVKIAYWVLRAHKEGLVENA